MKKLFIAALGAIATATLAFEGLVVQAIADAVETPISSTQAQPTPIPGTNVLIVPPEGFVSTTRFPGYQLEAANASIVVSEIPAPVSELAAGLTDPTKLATQGMLLLAHEEVSVAQQQALLLKVQQTAYGVDFSKWVLVLGNETETVLVTATFPQELEPEYSQTLKHSLLTTQWNSGTTALTEGLPFKLNEYGNLKLARRLSNALLYTKDGIFPAPSADLPVLIVAPSVSPQLAEPEVFARERLLATDNLAEIEIEDTHEIAVDNLDGYETIAQGKEQETGQEVTLYQVVLFEEDAHYYLLQGQISTDLSQQYLPIFKKMARSFERYPD